MKYSKSELSWIKTHSSNDDAKATGAFLYKKRKNKHNKKKRSKSRFSNDELVVYSGETRIEAMRRSQIDKSTESEKNVWRFLSDNKIPYSIQEPIVAIGKLFFIDIFIDCINTAIEVDGGYHKSEYMKNKDKLRDLILGSIGIHTIRINNQDTLSSIKMLGALSGVIELHDTHFKNL